MRGVCGGRAGRDDIVDDHDALACERNASGQERAGGILPAGGSVLLHKYPTLVHTACIAQPEELADTDTPAALAQLEALVREKG